MMEIDHISYIFGSFSRRRQSQEVGASKRRSVEPPKISHDRSNSAPHASQKPEVASPRSKTKSVCNFSADETRYKCPMCQKFFIEPRVLPCLHTFCTRCLQELEANDFASWSKRSEASLNGSSSNSDQNSGGSGYESDKLELANGSLSAPARKGISCPICGVRSSLAAGGVLGLAPHYLLQHRMILATLNARTTHLLCDLCAGEISATARCTECAISLCKLCAEDHLRHRSTSKHEVLTLDEARRKGITRVRRQVMCSTHPERELSIFCSSCCQVICRDCVSHKHRGHTIESVVKVVKSHTKNLREAVEKVRTASDQHAITASRLQAISKRIQCRSNQVHSEIERFIDNYARAIEEHRKNLFQQLNRTKDEKLEALEKQQIELQKRLKNAKDVIVFTDELLNEGTDVEVLSFVKPILNKLELYNKLDSLEELKVDENLQFLSGEKVPSKDDLFPLYGVITTQTVSAKHCILHTEGLHHLRVGRRTEVILETRDKNNAPLQRGGERITVDLRHRDARASKSLPIGVEDHRNGTYCICFTPDISGKFLLTVAVQDQSIKDNPFPIMVGTLRPHHGTYHCCSFCSSGGSKEASCGCGGKMPGGYKGCGHGHEGHPGRRHWSCCGNLLEHSECARVNSAHYQFTL